MPRFHNPSFVPSLKDARYWSLDWIKEQNIAGPFQYVVLLKHESGYKVFGQYATATEAFDDRRLLCEEHGTRSFFLRAVRVVPIEEQVVIGPGHPESREDLDRWRDALATGDEALIAPEELGSFRSWAASTIENRPAYQRVDRDAPRFEATHGEIPF
jgi:hypothetical protein